jgi:hypothetical protein
MGIKRYNITLEEKIFNEARKYLEIGQALSPVLNDLLRRWIEEKKQNGRKEKN